MGIGKQHLSTTAGVHRHAAAVTLQTDRSRSRPAHAHMEETLFERTLRQKTENSRSFNMNCYLRKFDDEGVRQMKFAEEGILLDQQAELDRIAAVRDRTKDRKEKMEAFKAQQTSDNATTHKAAVELRRLREQQDLKFELTFKEKTKRLTKIENAHANEAVVSGIEVFEDTMKRMSGSTAAKTSGEITKEEAEGATKLLDPSDFLKSLKSKAPSMSEMSKESEEYLRSVRERRKNEEAARQERDRRRRRGIIDQLNAQSEMEAKKRSEMLNSKLIKMSDSERKIAESLYQALASKAQFMETRRQRDEQYQQERQEQFEAALERNRLAFENSRSDYDAVVAADLEKHRQIREAKEYEKHQRNTEMCRGVACDLVDFAMRVGDYMQQSNGVPMLPKEWRDLVSLFLSSTPLFAPPEEAAEASNPDMNDDIIDSSDAEVNDEAKVKAAPEESVQQALVLDNAEYVDFVVGDGAWIVSTAKADAETGVDPSRVADELLGRIISECAAVIAPAPAAVEVPDIPRPQNRIVVVGTPCSGISKQCALLSDSLACTVFSVDAIVQAAIVASSGDDDDPNSDASLGKRAKESAGNGAAVEDDVIVKLIINSIKKLPSGRGWILDSFPQTATQAALLERALTGYSDPVDPPPPPPPSILAPAPPPSSSAASKDPPPSSGALIYVNLSVADDIALKRGRGRMLDPTTGTIYHVDFDPPPPKDKALISRLVKDTQEDEHLSKKVHAWRENSQSAFSWLQKFGNVVNVAAEGSISEVNSSINQAIAQAVEKSHQNAPAANQAAAPPAASEATPAADADAMDQAAVPGEEGDALASTQAVDSQPAPEPQAIHVDLAKALHEAWELTEKSFEGSVKRHTRCVRRQLLRMLKFLHRKRSEFIKFMNIGDARGTILDELVTFLNSLSEEQRSRDEIKSELHLRAATLQTKVWELCDKAREASEKELYGIMAEGWVNVRVRRVFTRFCALVQAELLRFSESVRIARDFHFAAFGLALPTCETPPPDVLSSTIDKFKADFERITAEESTMWSSILSDAPAAAAPVDPKAKGKAAAPAPAAAPVEAPKPGEGLTDGLRPVDATLFASFEACIQKSLQLAAEPDMACDGDERGRAAAVEAVQGVVGVETDILKRRLGRLKYYLRDTIAMFRQREADLHVALDNAIAQRFKSEMQAVAGLMVVLKKHIEKKTKVTHRLSIEQSTLLQDVATCLDPSDVFLHAPPPPIETESGFVPSGFQLSSLVSVLSTCAAGARTLDSSAIFPAISAALALGGPLLQPVAWQAASAGQWAELVACLDLTQSGVCDWSLLAVVMSGVRCAAEDLFEAAASAAAAQVDVAQAHQALAFLDRNAASSRDATGRLVYSGSNPAIVRAALISAFSSSGKVDIASLLISLSVRSLHASPAVAALSTAAHLIGTGSITLDAYTAAMRCGAHMPLSVSAKSARLSNDGTPFPLLPCIVVFSIPTQLPPPPPLPLSPPPSALLESFNALKSACNVDPAAESLPLQSLTGHEDFFAEESPYSLPLSPLAALVTLPAIFYLEALVFRHPSCCCYNLSLISLCCRTCLLFSARV